MSQFPQQVDTISNLWTVSNNAQSFLAVQLDNVSPNPVISVVDGSSFPDTRTTITIDREIFIVTKITPTTFATEQRGAFGTPQVSHNLLATCWGMSIAEYHNDVRDAIIATQTFSANWWRRPVIEALNASPLIGLNVDDCYIVAGLGGDWASATINDIAVVTAGSSMSWMFITPQQGMIVYNIDQTEIWTFDGVNWAPITVPATPLAIANTTMSRDANADTAVHQLDADSVAIGNQALVRIPGTVAVSHGRFSNTGDAQACKYIMRTHTTGALWTELFLDGTAGSQRLELPDDSTWSYQIQITAHRTDAGDGHAGYTAAGVIYRGAGVGSTTLQGKPTIQKLSESDPSWDINIEADTTNGSLKITSKGETGKIIRWVAAINTVEITN